MRRSRKPWRPLLAAMTVAATVLVAGVPAQAATAKIVVVKQASAGYTMGYQAALTTSSGATLVAWNEYYRSPNQLVVRRQAGTSGFVARALPMAGLTSVARPNVVEDPVGRRILLIASGYADGRLAETLGTYVWVSTTQGVTWSRPVKVWDSFGTSDVALDGKGGFYLVTGLTGSTVTHVPPSLSPQHWPGDQVELTDRISSRLFTLMTQTGPASTPLLMFWSNNALWVHPSATVGSGLDRVVLDRASGAGALAGDRRAAVAVGLRRVTVKGAAVQQLWVRPLAADSAGRMTLAAAVRVTPPAEYASWFTVSRVPGLRGAATGRFAVTWVTYDGALRMAWSSVGGRTWSKPVTLVKFPTSGYAYPDVSASSSSWTFVHAVRQVGGREAVLATRTPRPPA